MKTPWLWTGALLAWLFAGSANADPPYGARSGGNWRSPPPAWGYPPGATPYGTFRRQPDQGGWHDGRGRQHDDYYRRDRQRWRDDPYDRHESNRRDRWRNDRRDDWRGGNAYRDERWPDRRDERRQRGVIQSWPDERRYPPPAYGPYAPRPYRDYRDYRDYGGYRGYDDGRY